MTKTEQTKLMLLENAMVHLQHAVNRVISDARLNASPSDTEMTRVSEDNVILLSENFNNALRALRKINP